MSTKWYIGTLFLIFTYLGLFQKQAAAPNQEIVLEFADAQVEQQDIKTTIEDVRKKLLELEVSNIHIQETKNGTLKISYYSATHVDHIKEALLEENQLVVDQNSKEKEKNDTSTDYKIDVYELTVETDISHHKNKLVFESKYNTQRFTIDHHNGFIKNVFVLKANQLFKTAYNTHKNNPFIEDCTSHKKPEVRAGPYTYNI